MGSDPICNTCDVSVVEGGGDGVEHASGAAGHVDVGARARRDDLVDEPCRDLTEALGGTGVAVQPRSNPKSWLTR